MCLHVTLKYDRTFMKPLTDGGELYHEEVMIYVCEICKKEFEVIKVDKS